MTDKQIASYFSDRPVGLDGDLLWRDEIIRQEINYIAQRVVDPLREMGEYPDHRSDSMTFAIYGKWGMGKSSALRMLREQAFVIAKEVGLQDHLKFCTFAAPSYESLPYDVRTMLAMRILSSLSGDPAKALDEFLPEFVDASDCPNLPMPTSSRSWSGHALEQVAATLSRLVDFDRLIADYLTGGNPEQTTQVLLVLLDDLDRCQSGFIWKTLDTIQQFSDVPNIFFVLAVDQDQLRETVKERLGGARDPDFALEKYVQHAVLVPGMDEQRLQRFVEELLKRQGTGDAVDQALIANVQFLQYGLQERTPRSVKRCLNSIRFNLEYRLQHTPQEQWPIVIKERILEYTWPDFYQTSLVSAKEAQERRGGIYYHRAFSALEAACADFVMGGGRDEDQLRFQARRISELLNLDWENLPLDLIRYLGHAPYWFIETREDESNTILDQLFGTLTTAPKKADIPIMVSGDTESLFMQLYLQSEAAESAGDVTATLEAAKKLYDLVSSNRPNFNQSHCPIVGNVAINAERVGANPLAIALYDLAVDLDPEHSNNLQNYVDFIVKANLQDLYTKASQFIALLKTGKHAAHRPERTMALESRLNALMGIADQGIDESVVSAMIDEFAHSPSDQRKYVSLLTLLIQTNDLQAMQRVCRLHYTAVNTDTEKYVALRGLADLLAASPSERNELVAMDMYQYLIDSNLGATQTAQSNLADLAHNYATLLYKHDYDDKAGELWFEAQRLKPKDSSIRRAYPLYLLRAGHPDLAQKVSEGMPLGEQEKALQPSEKTIPERFWTEGPAQWWEGKP